MSKLSICYHHAMIFALVLRFYHMSVYMAPHRLHCSVAAAAVTLPLLPSTTAGQEIEVGAAREDETEAGDRLRASSAVVRGMEGRQGKERLGPMQWAWRCTVRSRNGGCGGRETGWGSKFVKFDRVDEERRTENLLLGRQADGRPQEEDPGKPHARPLRPAPEGRALPSSHDFSPQSIGKEALWSERVRVRLALVEALGRLVGLSEANERLCLARTAREGGHIRGCSPWPTLVEFTICWKERPSEPSGSSRTVLS